MKSTITCVAIDDEPLALEVIKRFSEKTPGLDLKGLFSNPLDALNFIEQEKVDLVFLDIHMPELTGMQLISSVTYKPMIIFTTAYAEYALESYEFDAVDYLLKPIPFERFVKAVNKAQQAQENSTSSNALPVSNTPNQDYIFIKSDTRFFKVNIDDIKYIEGMRDYVAVHTPKQRILTLMSMTKILEKLPSNRFRRVHKSYIIGVNHISLVQHNRVYIGETEIPISNSYKESFQGFIESRQA